jgi:hypothetical protein
MGLGRSSLLMLPTGAAGSRHSFCSSITPGHSRCVAASIFRAPHIEGEMLLPLSVHASERCARLHPQPFHLELKTRLPRHERFHPAARAFSVLSTNGLHSHSLFMKCICVFCGYFLEKSTLYEDIVHNMQYSYTSILFATLIRSICI